MNLYELLPAYYRQLDEESGGQLQQFVQVMQEQYDVLEADIAQLYENWFIETCAEWVAPYIGDLVGYKTAYETAQAQDSSSRQSVLTESILIPRRDVANTIRYRRRKGSLSLLESLSRDVAGWPAHAVEFGKLIAASAPVSFPFARRAGTQDVRLGRDLERLGTAFDTSRRNIDVRRINSIHQSGSYGPASVALFVSRMTSYPFLRSEPYQVEEAGDNCFTFSPLGNDSPLFTKPAPADLMNVPNDLRLPGPITRRALEEHRRDGALERGVASDHYYGEGKSIAIHVTGWSGSSSGSAAGSPAKTPAWTLVPADKVIPAHLGHWRYRTPPSHVALDPKKGRFAFAFGEEPDDVRVSYYTGFSAAMGGGQYPRNVDSVIPVIPVETGDPEGALSRALAVWREKELPEAAIEFTNSISYEEDRLHIELEDDQHLILRAADAQRPILRFVDTHQVGRSDGLTISGKPKSRLTIDGLLITGRGIHVRGNLAELTVQHSTLTPGWGLHLEGHPSHESEPSIVIQDSETRVRIRHSITGPIQVRSSKLQHEPNRISIEDSIIDATRESGEALCSPGSIAMFVDLRIMRSTVVGACCLHSLSLAQDSIFIGPVNVAARQDGCMRFCYVPIDSRTPRRYECQPDMAIAGLQGDELIEARLLIAPEFHSLGYGNPRYCRLTDDCADGIRKGASDKSEMGAFHDGYAPQREAGLISRLQDFVPAGTDVAIIFTT
ncbi:MAG TPA: hypothetical protein VKB79_27150 [Bryobacteraceae bacterium]|nr:hypothetical protein [Bryobacteraceae bacterium]